MAELHKVYDLVEALARDPEYVATVQALSLDSSRPHIGLSPLQGLFGSEEWIANIRSGAMPTRRRSGTIIRTYAAGMDSSAAKTSIEFVSDDGVHFGEGIFCNDRQSIALFEPGKRVEYVYYLQEMKDGQREEFVLEAYLSRKLVGS